MESPITGNAQTGWRHPRRFDAGPGLPQASARTPQAGRLVVAPAPVRIAEHLPRRVQELLSPRDRREHVRRGARDSSGMAAYAVSKAALVHLTRVLDLELRPLGIRVNAVAHQLLDTAANRAAFPDEAMAYAVAPEAVADIIAYLVSDAAAPVSGAIVPAYGA
jgi:NAD(P)-dependent dehydrogenase (short-subunit alcohol dehydrogenase family)